MDIAPAALICVDEDRDRARDLARPWLATYLGAMGAKQKNFYVETAERFGHGETAREVQRLFAAGDRVGAAKALTPELIEGSAICCDYGELDERLAAYERAGRGHAAGAAVRRSSAHHRGARRRRGGLTRTARPP